MHTKDNFSRLYQILFYYGFINFRKEHKFKQYLEAKNFIVYTTDLVKDAVLDIDLIALKDNQK
ncbi:hypothetical protein [Mycoplasmopsis lipofaciens]|uniref:hypothetical protein n=1 Tax=Mycoplasmopsis lipofaciens TaxID=114884 RepID=UPI0004896C50|nr:hypothetical protein [Mycoplasmopsis lipofaciens]